MSDFIDKALILLTKGNEMLDEKDERIKDLEKQLAATTESLSESECSLLISEDIADRLQNNLAAVIQICKTEYDAAYDLKNDILDIVGEAK